MQSRPDHFWLILMGLVTTMSRNSLEITIESMIEFIRLLFLQQSLLGVQPSGISGPRWKKKGCLEPPIEYIATRNHTHTQIS